MMREFWDAVLFRVTDPWWWSMVFSGIFAVGTLMCGVLIWAFKPENVSYAAKVFFHVSLAIFVLRRFVGVVTISFWIFDWVAVFVTGLVAVATVTLLVALHRSIERQIYERKVVTEHA